MIPCHYEGCAHASADEGEHYRHWLDTHPVTTGSLHGREFDDYGPGL